MPMFEFPDKFEVADASEPSVVFCATCDVVISAPDTGTEEMPDKADDDIPLDIIFDMCTAIGVPPIVGSPIELPPAIEAEVITWRCWERLFRMLTFAGAGTAGRDDCDIGFTNGLISCVVSILAFIS